MNKTCEYVDSCGMDYCRFDVECPDYKKKMKPILFNGDMVKAILEGRKTQTRRVIKPQPGCIQGDSCYKYNPFTEFEEIKSRYQVGDVLYVRETFGKDKYGKYHYRAEYPEHDCEPYPIWHPSIHMPREAARIFLKVTNIKVERLWDISEEDAKAEGITSYWAEPHRDVAPFIGAAKEVGADLCSTRCEAFEQLWNSTVKKQDLDKYGWSANPWVWVIEFEKVEGLL